MEPARALTQQIEEIAALIAERNGTVRRIITLDNVVVAARLGRKPPETIERLQAEIRSMRARVRVIDKTISDD